MMQDEKGNWHVVGSFLARDKTCPSFRDADINCTRYIKEEKDPFVTNGNGKMST